LPAKPAAAPRRWRWPGCGNARSRRSPSLAPAGSTSSKDNLDSLALTLNASQLERLDRASAIELGFPHDFFGKEMVPRMVFAGYSDRIDRACLERAATNSGSETQ
jgi:hypothetical protein